MRNRHRLGRSASVACVAARIWHDTPDGLAIRGIFYGLTLGGSAFGRFSQRLW
jgi:hypothetical protein